MTTPEKTDAEKREDLRARINAGQERSTARDLAGTVRDVADNALDYVKANPIKAVAAVAVGALVLGALSRPGRRAGRRAGAFAGLATDAALAYGSSLLHSAGSSAGRGQDRAAHFADIFRDRASSWQDTAAREGNDLSNTLVRFAKEGSRKASRTLDDLRRSTSR